MCEFIAFFIIYQIGYLIKDK